MSAWTGGRCVASHPAALGVDRVFSVPGSQVLPIWDGLDGQRLVVPRTERAAAFMAEGFGQASGRPALVLSTLGPGVANELVGLRSALQSHTPVVCVTPWQPAAKRARLREVFQGLDQPAFFAGVCKRNIVVDDQGSIGDAVREAVDAAVAEPSGPVRVDVAFPLLFRRARAPRPAAPAPVAAPVPTGDVLVTETPGPAGLSPGIGTPGFALPFALGVKLALPRSRVRVETERCHVRANLDTLVVAGQCGAQLDVSTATEARR